MANERKILRCAVYTRKSSEHGLERDFNSLDAQREAAEAYIKSQTHEGWKLIKTQYNDGGLSGGTLQRPALQSLLADIRARKIDVVVVYKVDRLTRSLADFAKLVELFEAQGVSFVSVTQQFNTTTSMGRLTLNVLLSFAQFEREIAGERIRDKFAASRRKGMWMGGTVPLGYDVRDHKLIVNEAETETVRLIFQRYLTLGCVSRLRVDLDRKGVRSKQRNLTSGRVLGGGSFRPGRALSPATKPNLPWAGGAQGHRLSGRARGDRERGALECRSGQALGQPHEAPAGPDRKRRASGPVSSSMTAVTECLRPTRCVGETATAITSVRRACGAAR